MKAHQGPNDLALVELVNKIPNELDNKERINSSGIITDCHYKSWKKKVSWGSLFEINDVVS